MGTKISFYAEWPSDEVKRLLKECIKEEIGELSFVNQDSPHEHITENEAREITGLSKVTLKKKRDEGVLPFSRIGTRIRYKRSDVMNLFEEGRRGVK